MRESKTPVRINLSGVFDLLLVKLWHGNVIHLQRSVRIAQFEGIFAQVESGGVRQGIQVGGLLIHDRLLASHAGRGERSDGDLVAVDGIGAVIGVAACVPREFSIRAEDGGDGCPSSAH